ncbi:MAG: hypothetical protein Ta2D_10080 [Rickettsiales bacterium]|nr:MAG: hypothetical protein Ta2D_10080 [Rickettsiales bacterium]
MEFFDKYLSLIKKREKIETFKIVNSGLNSFAIIINNEFIFRFPNRDYVIDEYKKEKVILDELRPIIESVEIPTMQIFNENGVFYTKHLLIKGENLKTAKNKIDNKKIAKDLAIFLAELHSLDVVLLQPQEFKTTDYEIYLEYLTKKEIKDFEDCLNYLNRYDKYPPNDNVMCHNDLHENNILIHNGRLSGIIDFASAVCRKRDNDFARLLKFSPKLTLLWIKEYEKITNTKIDFEYIYKLEKFRCYGTLMYRSKIGQKDIAKYFRDFVVSLNLM